MAKIVKYSLVLICFLSLGFIVVRFSLLYRAKLITKVKIYSFNYEGESVKLKQDGDNTIQLAKETGNNIKTTITSLSQTIKPILKTTQIPEKLPTIKSIVFLEKTTTKVNLQSSRLCSKDDEKLVGALTVDQRVPETDEKIQAAWSEKDWVEKGGTWKPKKCQAVRKVAIIIPYRKREEQLRIFVRHMHPMLKRQLLDYRIIVIEQDGETPFNRAMLFNIGYKESLKLNNFTCFVFHDVDLIPENDHNYYGCPTSPRHMSVAIDKFKYRLPYKGIFGGAGSFSKKHFEQINGFSNTFWGWGGEDDDLFKRISAKKLSLTRPGMTAGRYKMVRIFHQSAKANPMRTQKLRESVQKMSSDGLNSLKYRVRGVVEHPFYTKITVIVDPKQV